MAFALKDRVLETASSPGTGSAALLGATTGYNSFGSSLTSGDTTYYTIADQAGSNWEVGLGTYNSSGNVLVRNTVYANSLGTTAYINFSSGTQNVFITQPAENTVVSSNNPGTSGYALVSNGAGLAPNWQPLSGSATPALTQTSFTATAGQTIFTLSAAFTFVQVFLNGVRLIPTTEYTVSSPTVTLVTGASSGDNLSVLAFAQVDYTNVAITGGTINGTSIGATTPSTGAFTNLSSSGTVSGTGFSALLASPTPIGSTTANTGAFTNLSSSGTVSGTGFTSYFASPPPVGSTARNTGAFTTLSENFGPSNGQVDVSKIALALSMMS